MELKQPVKIGSIVRVWHFLSYDEKEVRIGQRSVIVQNLNVEGGVIGNNVSQV